MMSTEMATLALESRIVERVDGEDWPELAIQLRVRMKALGFTQQDVQRLGGPSTAKLREVLNGRSQVLSPGLRRGLEHAVKWPRGAIEEILAGRAQAIADIVGAAGAGGVVQEPRHSVSGPDDEFLAMQKVVAAVEGLDGPAQRRVLAWALDRCVAGAAPALSSDR